MSGIQEKFDNEWQQWCDAYNRGKEPAKIGYGDVRHFYKAGYEQAMAELVTYHAVAVKLDRGWNIQKCGLTDQLEIYDTEDKAEDAAKYFREDGTPYEVIEILVKRKGG